MTWTLCLRGGAGRRRSPLSEDVQRHFEALLQVGGRMLTDGATAFDVVAEMAAELEACGFHNAGRGAVANRDGMFELDAAIMKGPDRRAGAVAALVGFGAPIRVAQALAGENHEENRCVMLAGVGAALFASAQGFEAVSNAYFAGRTNAVREDFKHGTIGAVALDKYGNLAAATSTGGVGDKKPGRVGDSPIIGAGCWADDLCAVSCTGLGEYFIRANVGAEIGARMRLAHEDVTEAAESALAAMARLGGEGGLIAVDASGQIAAPFNAPGMLFGYAKHSGELVLHFDR